MKKKYLVTTIAMLATVSMLAACSNEPAAEDNKTTPAPTVTVAPTEEATPGDRGDGPVKPTEAPSNTPDETVAHNQMLQNVAQALKETYGMLYAPDMQMQNDEFYMKDTLGLEASWYDAAYVEVPGMSFGADKLIMIHPTEGNLENVQKALNTFRDNQIADTFQYPSTLPQRQAIHSGKHRKAKLTSSLGIFWKNTGVPHWMRYWFWEISPLMTPISGSASPAGRSISSGLKPG